MRQLLYISNTALTLPAGTLDGILETSRRRNGAAGITGMLLHMEGAFLQVLEGEPVAIDETFARIRADARHWGAHTLVDQQVAARSFAQWSMGFARLAPSPRDAEASFRISRDAVAARLAPGTTVEIVALLDAFQRVHGGETLSSIGG